MFKRALGIVAILGLFNIMLCFQQNKFAGDAQSAVYPHESESLIGYLWGIFDDDVKAGNNMPHKATGRFLPAQSFSIPPASATLSGCKPASGLLVSALKIGIPEHRNRISLLPEHQNYLFRLKPF